MGFVAKESGGDFVLAPAGNHIARCVQMIDLGTQYSEFYDKSQHKLIIGWELPSEPNGDKGVHIVFKRYTVSLHENSSLRKDLESWRGRKFTDKEREGFDVSKVLGHPCMVNVSHDGRDGRTYANVDAVAPLPKGMECPVQVSGTVKFDIESPDMEVFDTFSDKLKETIKKAKEWNGNGEHAAAGAGAYDPYDDRSIPF